MKRALWPLLSIAVFVVGLWFVVYVLSERESPQWQALPGGGEVRFVTATKGPNHQVVLPGPPLEQRIRDAIRTRTWAPLKRSRSLGPSLSSGTTDFGVWLEWRGSTSIPGATNSALHLSDGRKLVTAIGMGGGPGSSYYTGSFFEYIPFREKTLRYSCTISSKPFEFTFKNPAYRSDLPVWKGSPLPQTRQNGDLTLTLRGLAIERSPFFSDMQRFGEDCTARPIWSLTKAGEKADKWFNLGVSFADPSGQTVSGCGLFSEPVWEVRCTVHRTNEYPFQDDEVEWLGTAVPEPPEPETYQLFPIPAASQSQLKLAGLFGPGQYRIQNGAIVQTQAAEKVDPVTHPKIKYDFDTKEVNINLEEPGVVFVGSTFLVFRDANGRPARLDDDFISEGAVSVEIYHFPNVPIRIGTANSSSWQFDFRIPSPEKPRLNKVAAKP